MIIGISAALLMGSYFLISNFSNTENSVRQETPPYPAPVPATEDYEYELEDEGILEDEGYFEEVEKEDNSWLIGRWGPITFGGGEFSNIIESITCEIEIVDDHTLIERSRTKYTLQAIVYQKAKGRYTGDVNDNMETHYFTVDNKNNCIYGDDLPTIPFNKEFGYLDYGNGRHGSGAYMYKQVR